MDGHVHFHSLSRVAPTLDAAAGNFRALPGNGGEVAGMLLLAQGREERVFETLAARGQSGSWRLVSEPGEPETLLARRGSDAIAVVCGRQVRTREGLEVLGLGTLQEFADGGSLPDTIKIIRRAGAVAVIPWGFGKWWGRRGRLVDAALDAAQAKVLFVADNGGRPGWIAPRLLAAARRRGFRNLMGSDPFSVGRDYRRVGSFGFLAPQPASGAGPWRALRAWLLDEQGSPEPYGRTCGFGQFAVNQVGIRLPRRTGRGAVA